MLTLHSTIRAESGAPASSIQDAAEEEAVRSSSTMTQPPVAVSRVLADLLASQHLEELEAFGEEVATVLELERSRKAAESAPSASVPAEAEAAADESLVEETVSQAKGSQPTQSALVDVGTISAALQTIMPKEDALRCLETVTGLAGLTQQGHDLATAVPADGALLDVTKVLLLLRASCLLRPQRSYDLAGALAWARGAKGGVAGGAGSLGVLPDVA